MITIQHQSAKEPLPLLNIFKIGFQGATLGFGLSLTFILLFLVLPTLLFATENDLALMIFLYALVIGIGPAVIIGSVLGALSGIFLNWRTNFLSRKETTWLGLKIGLCAGLTQNMLTAVFFYRDSGLGILFFLAPFGLLLAVWHSDYKFGLRSDIPTIFISILLHIGFWLMTTLGGILLGSIPTLIICAAAVWLTRKGNERRKQLLMADGENVA